MYTKIAVTTDEMMRMRESGMSNSDIAKSLDISVATVRRYIGKQDRKMEGYAAFKNPPHGRMETVSEVPMIPKYEPKPVLEQYRIGGMLAELDSDACTVTVANDHGEITLDYEEIPDIVQFLAWAMRERMEVSADAEAEQIRESEGDAERGEF